MAQTVNKAKRDDWLKTNGTKDIMQKLALHVDTLAEKAASENIKFKENVVDENMDIFDQLDTESEGSEDQIIDESDRLDLSIEKELSGDSEPQVPQTKAPVTKEAVEDSTEPTVEGDLELVDALVEELVTPLIKEFKTLKDSLQLQIKELNDKIVKMEKQYREKEVQEDINELVPVSSRSAQIRERLQKHFAGDSTFGSKPLETNDPILGKKPKEKAASGNGTFDGFVDGN